MLLGGAIGFATRPSPGTAGGPPRGDGAAEPAPAEIAWLDDYDAALDRAAAEGKLVVIDFFATWCGPCTLMEHTTFADEEVRRRMRDFVPLKVDVDRQRDLAAMYDVQSLPTTAVVLPDGRPIAGALGYLDATRFLDVLSGARRDTARHEARGPVGRPAPPLGVDTWFNLPPNRQAVDVETFRGQVVYLFAFQSWRPGCHSHGFPTLVRLMEHCRDSDDVAFLAVQTAFEGFGVNTARSAKETADRYGLTGIPVGHSGSAQARSALMDRYGTRGTPWTIVIDRAGIVRYSDFRIDAADAIALIDELLQARA